MKSRTLAMGTVLQSLFGAIVLVAVATLAFPIYGEFRKLGQSEKVVDVAAAGRELFTGLQNTRITRGPTRVALTAEPPASDAFFAANADARKIAEPAIARVIELCANIDCTGPETEIFEGLPASLQKLEAMRAEADAALKVPLAQRREGIAKDFNAAATDVIDRLEKMSLVLGETIRMVDPETAELMAIKQAAWLSRDGVGLERTNLSEARRIKEVTPELDRKMADLRGRALVNWSVLNELVARPGAPAELVELTKAAEKEAFETFEKIRKTAYDEAVAKKQPYSISNDKLNEAGNAALDALTAISNSAMRLAQEHAEQTYATAKSALMVQLSVLVAVLALGIAGFFVVQRRITRPIAAMTAAMRDLAQGNLQIDIPGADRGDEMGAMAAAVEVFKHGAIERVRLEKEAVELTAGAAAERRRALSELANGFGQKVGSLVDALVLASSKLETTADDMLDTAGKTSEQSSVLADSAHETGANVQTVAAATEELASSANEIGTQIAHTAETARKAVEDVRMTDKTVQALSASAEKIETVVALINDIAARTNLLALNATIEAARAGEAGRGFAVVASEVKDLATQTIRATDEIATQIRQLQQVTSGAVEAIQSIGATIEQVHEIATTIAAAAEEQQSATFEIARSVSQAATGTQRVTDSIGAVQDAATRTGSSAADVQTSAKELARSSHDLRSEMQSFIAGIEAA
jgi:methyl-accepting chemotaxis protein